MVAVFQLGLNGHEFLALVADNTTPRDLWVCSVKALVFGVVICTVSCYQGFHSPSGPDGVGRATNAAVVVSAVGCAGLNYVVSQVAYG